MYKSPGGPPFISDLDTGETLVRRPSFSNTCHYRLMYINRAHRWFLVEASLGDGVTVGEGFKF